MKHSDTINYPGGLEQLATDLGNLRYDTLGEFLQLFAVKLETDAQADESRERLQLAFQLASAAGHIQRAWDICKPYMT